MNDCLADGWTGGRGGSGSEGLEGVSVLLIAPRIRVIEGLTEDADWNGKMKNERPPPLRLMDRSAVQFINRQIPGLCPRITGRSSSIDIPWEHKVGDFVWSDTSCHLFFLG